MSELQTREFICIRCPFGCRLRAAVQHGAVTSVSGNLCARGTQYAQQEAIAPERIITSLMRLANRARPLSVKTLAPVPKARFFECVAAIRAARPAAPVRCGDVVLRDLCGTGVDVVATQDAD